MLYRRRRLLLLAQASLDHNLRSLLESLYGNGEQGAFYVPKPQVLGQQVLFQDAAGTVPVTADGDPVGLMLDISQGLELGPELVPNGDFSRGMDEWDNRTVGNGQCEAVDGGIYISSTDVDNRGGFSQHITGIVENGRSYIATYEISEVSGGGVHFGWGADYGGSHRYGHSYVTEPGVYSFIIPSLGGVNQVLWARSHRDGGSGVISNISVREIYGNHATQEVSGRRPIYRTDGQYHWLEGDGVDDWIHTQPIGSLAKDATGISLVMAATRQSVALRVSQYSSAGNRRVFGTMTLANNQNDYEWSVQNNGSFNQGLNVTLTAPTSSHVFSGRWRGAGTRNEARLNGGAWETGNILASAGTPIEHMLEIFSINEGTTHTDGLFYGLMVRDAFLSDEYHARVESYLASLAGVTLDD